MTTLREQELKKNVLDEVRYPHTKLAISMLVIFLWGPFVGLTLTLFVLTRNPQVQSHYRLPAKHVELVKRQLHMRD